MCCAVAALIFWRKSDDRMRLFVSLALLTFGTATFVFTLEALAVRHPAWKMPVDLLHFLGLASFGLFLHLFPDGRFLPRWVRWVVLVWIAWQLPRYFFPDWHLDPNAWYLWAEAVVWSAALGTGVYAQAYRYRRVSKAMQRQQIKWGVLGITSALSVFVGINLAVSAFAPAPTSPRAVAMVLFGDLFVYAAMLLIPVSIDIAMLRHNLFGVNFVINRALVYGALTASIVLLYVMVVGGLGELLQTRGNLMVSLIATGLAAVLFQPLRERLQRTVNRLMYGERDDPYAVLSRLGQRLETSLAPDAVQPAAVNAVAEALKLPYVAVEVGKDGALETAAATGEPADEPLRLPLVYGGETVGRLVLGHRPGEEDFAPADRQLLEDLAHQIGVAAQAVRLTDEAVRLSADSQRSRERLVTAREEERRRLRRDLHDGFGPQLVGLTMTAEAARDLVSTDPKRAKDLLGDLTECAQAAVSDVRRLVYALRPPALDVLGLPGALRAHADHHNDGGIRVTVEAPEQLPSLPAAVEVAAYRIALEAINNAERHAAARACVVRVALEEAAAVLYVEVTDDGRGVEDDRGTGVGLSSMRERAAELGGWCTVETPASGGTNVRAFLPCGSGTADASTKLRSQEE
ncbi:MAG: GAF domain-containing sensor histidine kinase [Actinomycetota bacterium]|nr:GAF domain-containing sensor histidine kinase [Actinomycetota bacterium]